MTDLDYDDLVRGTADAAFIVDTEGSIVAWNLAAEELLGFTAAQVVGRPCHEVLCGLDPFGNRYCGEHCTVARMTEQREPVRQFTMQARREHGDLAVVTVSVLQLPADSAGRRATLHLLTDGTVPVVIGAAGSSAAAASIPPRSGGSLERERLRSLTPREVEVLRLLAAGHASQDVANELSISVTTVRTHTQNILRKLEVHSQIEAVALAYRGGLI